MTGVVRLISFIRLLSVACMGETWLRSVGLKCEGVAYSVLIAQEVGTRFLLVVSGCSALAGQYGAMFVWKQVIRGLSERQVLKNEV